MRKLIILYIYMLLIFLKNVHTHTHTPTLENKFVFSDKALITKVQVKYISPRFPFLLLQLRFWF